MDVSVVCKCLLVCAGAQIGDLLVPPTGLIPWFLIEGNTYLYFAASPFPFQGKNQRKLKKQQLPKRRLRSKNLTASRGICRCSYLNAIYTHQSHKPEDPFRSSRGSCLERGIALYLFKLFGNLLPKREKVYRSLGFERERMSRFCSLVLLSFCYFVRLIRATCLFDACEILRLVLWLIILCLMCA